MNKKIIITAVLFFSLNIIYSESKFKLNLEQSFGFKNGHLGEYALVKEPNYSDDKLSYLNWEVKNQFYTNIALNGSYKDLLFSSDFSVSLPGYCGKMEDSDWWNNLYDNHPAADPTKDYKTHFSVHDNYLDYDFSFSEELSYKFNISQRFILAPKLSFEYSNIKFSGKDGEGWHGKVKSENGSSYRTEYTSDEIDHLYWSGTVIEYNRIQYSLWTGVNLNFYASNFCFNLGFDISPYTYTYNEDNHHGPTANTGRDYVDICQDFFSACKINMGFSYAINKLEILFNYNYYYLNRIRGKNYIKDASATKYSESTNTEGGADAEFNSLSVGLKYHFIK